MAKQIHIHLPAGVRVSAGDAGFEESKHPRADNGQFGKGGGGAKSGAPAPSPAIPDDIKARLAKLSPKIQAQQSEGKATEKRAFSNLGPDMPGHKIPPKPANAAEAMTLQQRNAAAHAELAKQPAGPHARKEAASEPLGFHSMSVGQRALIERVRTRSTPSNFGPHEAAAAHLTVGALKVAGIQAKAITGGEGNTGIQVVKNDGGKWVNITHADMHKVMGTNPGPVVLNPHQKGSTVRDAKPCGCGN